MDISTVCPLHRTFAGGEKNGKCVVVLCGETCGSRVKDVSPVLLRHSSLCGQELPRHRHTAEVLQNVLDDMKVF